MFPSSILLCRVEVGQGHHLNRYQIFLNLLKEIVLGSKIDNVIVVQ